MIQPLDSGKVNFTGVSVPYTSSPCSFLRDIWILLDNLCCCLGAALALSLLWQSSQLKRWSFSFISDADLADTSDCKCFLILPLCVCVCVLLINSQWFYSKWAWQSEGSWQQEHIVGPLAQMHLSCTRHLCSLKPGLFLHQQREEI